MNRRERVAVFMYQQSRTAWRRWRLNGCKITKVMGPLFISGEVMRG